MLKDKIEKKYQLKKDKKTPVTRLTCQTRNSSHETEITS
jgi:hypothetical protein